MRGRSNNEGLTTFSYISIWYYMWSILILYLRGNLIMKDTTKVGIIVSTMVAGCFFLGLAIGSSKCEASSENYLIFHSISKHSKSKEDGVPYNENNYTLGYEYITTTPRGRRGFTAVIYKDSYGTYAKYVARIHEFVGNKWGSFGVLLGVVQSPSYKEGDPLPMILPRYEYKFGNFGINAAILPKFKSNGAYVVGVQFKVKL